jgi:hypothetical protein
MKVSSLKMPEWWQSLWRRRYPMGANGHLTVLVNDHFYGVSPMKCGCGYRVWYSGQRIGSHRPTLGGALRQARRHAVKEFK